MSNYADPTATKVVFLEPCRCPNQPHAKDQATIVTLLGYGAKGAVREATRRSGLEAGHLVLILRGVRSWNLTLPDGSPRPLDAEQVQLLDDGTVQWLIDELDPAWAEDDLPKRIKRALARWITGERWPHPDDGSRDTAWLYEHLIMAELPGWDRTRLATADPADVAAARWLVYARVMAPQATKDYAEAIRDVELAGMKEPGRTRELERDRKVLVEQLRAGQREQPEWRRLLLLDGDDDPETDEDDA